MVVMSNEYKVYHDWENPSILGNNSYMHQQKYINDGHSMHTKNQILNPIYIMLNPTPPSLIC